MPKTSQSGLDDIKELLRKLFIYTFNRVHQDGSPLPPQLLNPRLKEESQWKQVTRECLAKRFLAFAYYVDRQILFRRVEDGSCDRVLSEEDIDENTKQRAMQVRRKEASKLEEIYGFTNRTESWSPFGPKIDEYLREYLWPAASVPIFPTEYYENRLAWDLQCEWCYTFACHFVHCSSANQGAFLKNSQERKKGPDEKSVDGRPLEFGYKIAIESLRAFCDVIGLKENFFKYFPNS